METLLRIIVAAAFAALATTALSQTNQQTSGAQSPLRT
jgi:hypothetical protein